MPRNLHLLQVEIGESVARVNDELVVPERHLRQRGAVKRVRGKTNQLVVVERQVTSDPRPVAEYLPLQNLQAVSGQKSVEERKDDNRVSYATFV